MSKQDEGAEGQKVPDPNNLFGQAHAEILACLRRCQESGSFGQKGKHDHDMPTVETGDDLQLSTYWSRNCVGIKVKDAKGKFTHQVCYFSRSTGCCATNLVLAKHWVRLSTLVCSYDTR